MFIAAGIAWPNHLAVVAISSCVLYFVTTEVVSLGVETVLLPWVNAAKQAGKVVPGNPRRSRMVHRHVADSGGKKELGRPAAGTHGVQSRGRGGAVGKPRLKGARRRRHTG